MLHGHMMDLIIVQDVRVAKPMTDRKINPLFIMRLNVLQPFNLCARSSAVSQRITRQNDAWKCDLFLMFKNSMNVIRNIQFPSVRFRSYACFRFAQYIWAISHPASINTLAPPSKSILNLNIQKPIAVPSTNIIT